MAIDLENYNTVPERVEAFFAKYPDGRLRQVSYELVVVGQQTYLIYTAAAMRDKDDTTPGLGTAWEPVPGKTPYTRDSEMQNAETSAWGRAIIAVGAADSRKGIASREDVQNRQPVQRKRTFADEARDELRKVCQQNKLDARAIATRFADDYGHDIKDATVETVRAFRQVIADECAVDEAAAADA